MNRLLAALVAALALLAGCGDSGSQRAATTSTTSGSRPVDVPDRIVSMSPTATEMLFAIGADDQVVAVDDQSNFPKGVPKTKLSAFEPNVEAITEYEPDLVVISDDTKGLKASLTKLGVEVVVAPAAETLDDTYQQLATLGAKTGHRREAARVVSSIKAKIAEIVAKVPKRATPLTYYHELDTTLFSATSKTFIGQLYSLAGLRNVADAADADGQAGGYPQLSAEYLVDADPDLVFLADTKCCQQTPTTFAARPGFARLKAVRNDRVIGLDDDIASRWGPRVTVFLETIVKLVRTVPER